MTHSLQINKRKTAAAFTLVEVVVSIAILALAFSGMIYGYVQTNYRAEWSSMSLAAQSLAIQSVEEARAAKWDIYSSDSGTNPDELGVTNYTQIFSNALLVPSSGKSITVTNHVWITQVSAIPQVRQIRADCVWQFPRTGTCFTNTEIILRGAN